MAAVNAPLIVIVGPTASGKSALAMRLAREFNGEIIAADSRTIYTGLDIGTAKPTKSEQNEIRHWGIDLVVPGQPFSVKDFQEYAYAAIQDIRDRGKTPILVGGTGLYVDAVVFSYSFPDAYRDEERHRLMELSLEQLHEYCYKNNIELPENRLNKRYVINAILRAGNNGVKRRAPLANSYIVGIATEKETLRSRITERAKSIVSAIGISEALAAGEKYGWNNEAMTGNIYRLVRDYDPQTETIDMLRDKFVTLDWRLAKRQLTWLKRNEHILWLTADEAYTYCARILAKMNNS
jgi:tRNA dimethylallyltransferase